MNGICLELQDVLLLTLACLAFTIPGKGQATYYCDNGNVQNIAGESSSTIITRKPGERHYSNNLDCGWTIDAGVDKRVKLTVSSLDLQWAASYALCSGYDHLTVRDGPTESSVILMDICDSTNPYQLVSSGQHLYLFFVSNDKNFYDHSGITLKFETFDENACPPGWTNLSTSYYCYSMMTLPVGGTSYTLAQQYCGYSQSNLVKMDSTQLFNAVQDYGKNVAQVSKAWIGLNDLETEDTYRWLDGSTLASSDKIDRFSGSEDKDCVVHDFDLKKWVVKSCKDEKMVFMCAKARVGPTTVYSVPTASDDDSVGGNVTMIWAIVLGIVGGILCVLLLFFFYCCYQKKKPPRRREYRATTCQQPNTEDEGSRRRHGSSSSVSMSHISAAPAAPTAPPINMDGSTTLVWGDEYGPAPPSYEESMQHPCYQIIKHLCLHYFTKCYFS
ncbi:uncharacterized protein LOC117338375 [Pecten maximus]|uniref:uncharacterized protein LOC117338375 n=1 Tax=Pecten maximus TaxID=6579 RepID=UPI0014586D2C|nr:uncharacterized protein LOC117338375 [Pecten maximus]